MDLTLPGDKLNPNPHLRIFLLGEPYLFDVRENRKFVLPSRCLTLLAFLLLNRKTRLRESIATALWPDTLECEARGNLRRVLYQLVRTLPDVAGPWLTHDARRLEWNPLASYWCDVDAFEHSSRSTHTQPDAVALYGELLAGDESQWVIEQRTHLRERQVDVLYALAEANQRSGDFATATMYWRRLLAIDPFREDAFRSLFELRSASGDRAGATCEYRAFVYLLREELGVEPMPETVACYERVVRGGRTEAGRLRGRFSSGLALAAVNGI